MIPSATAISEAPISAIADESPWVVTFSFGTQIEAAAGTGTTIYAATDPFVTMAGDQPPDLFFPSKLRRTFTYERSVLGAADFSGLSVSIGRIELDNTDGYYDDLVTGYTPDGGIVTLKVGVVDANGRADYASFQTAAVFIGSRMTGDISTVMIDLRDKSYRLDQPASPNVYGGAGGLDGGAEVAGKRKPRAFGWVDNVTPAPVIPADQVYQINDGPVQAISAVYDTGVPLTFDADYATSVLLRNATLVPGEYATCIAEGLFRLGGSAYGVVTADVQGDNDGGFVETTAAIIERLVLTATDLESSDIAANTFQYLDLQQDAPVGYFIGHATEVTVAEVANNLMRGVGGYVGFAREGLLEVGIIDAPGLVAPIQYDETEFISIQREPLPDDLSPPPQRVRVTYANNWTPLETVAGEVTDDDRIAELKEPHKIATTSDADAAALLRVYPSARDPEPVVAYFRDEADALAEAERRFTLLTAKRAIWRGTVPLAPFVHDIGEAVHVTVDRYELSAGKVMRVLSVRDDIGSNSQEIAGLV